MPTAHACLEVCEWLINKTWRLHKTLGIGDRDRDGQSCINYAEGAKKADLGKWLTKCIPLISFFHFVSIVWLVRRWLNVIIRQN